MSYLTAVAVHQSIGLRTVSLSSYQSLEIGETKLDLERLEKISDVLDTSMEELMRPEGYYIHQEIHKGGNGPGVNFGNENTYNYGVEKEILDRLVSAKDDEIFLLKEENKYLKEKIDQLLDLVGKK
ncbi:helix-turn-helix domain-containing protein [Geofilum rubicundum]|uniref:helix-turn-helix domain-containing protein n=1 Tax=Geofilum rubicundum TaxID=472113 RepID=UPI00138E0077|nr:helix-turn-helix transcriptional regulator [Geofilum rubicundum]